MIWCLSAWWLVMDHRRLFVLAQQWSDASAWGWQVSLAVGIVCVHVLLLGALAVGPWLKPAAAVLTVVAALSSYFSDRYGVYLDPSMMRNVLHTDTAEAVELIGPDLVWHVLSHAGVPLLAVVSWPLPAQSWGRTLRGHLLSMLAAALALALAVMLSFQPLASLMRNHKELRYLVTPAAALWSSARVWSGDTRQVAGRRQPLGLDAVALPFERPRLLVIVVGETVRSANWGLSGYGRDTTPGLSQRAVVNFAQVTSCGTNTEVSVPCLFAPVGRRDYDEDRIRRSESLLHVLARAGVAVQWIDNQSGCKGVCEGLPSVTVAELNAPGTCEGPRCWDEGLIADLTERLQRVQGQQVLVLHMLGNHGPSYFRRYPRAFAQFQPECLDDELHRCSKQAIVNAYDNAVLYTDHVLSRLIDTLAAGAARVDTAMLYVSDHGESLGEAGLYLHGLPYAIAPTQQTQVPMVLWWSEGYGRSLGLDKDCMSKRAHQPAQHDHVFHTVLALTQVHTALYDPAWDLTSTCRRPSGPPGLLQAS
ncbi:phosphoethanolamine transferase [Caldimonas sp.]|uniref:phosphoethanolamine transferase n=1 Tax=Caldimonas sp. TaxID=2838790 RepID=UPI00391B3C2B